MQNKSFDIVETKADGESGTFEALVAVFNNVDSVGDRILPGAFAKTLQKWQGTGDPIPVIWSHKHDDPMAHIGTVQPSDMVETDRGLVVRGRLDIADNPMAKQVHRLMKQRALKEFSFGYRVPKGGEKRAKDGANELSEIDLIEVGPTLKGANPATELHAVKSGLTDEIGELATELKALSDVIAEATEAHREMVKDALADLVKATWTAAFINTLPDSSFLFVESGGEKDDEGKTTPRSLRHFPVKDASGKVDLPHLRNALSRIPQSNLPQATKDRLSAEAQRMLDAQKADDGQGRKSVRSADPLRKQARAVELEFLGRGLSESPPKRAQPKPELLPLKELKARMREEMLTSLSGGINEQV